MRRYNKNILITIFSVILGSLKWVKNLKLYFLFIPITTVMESHIMCTEECFSNCFISRTQNNLSSSYRFFFFKCQDNLFQMPWLHNEGETLHGIEQQKQKKRMWKLFSTFWKCVGVQGVSSSTAVGGISIFCWEFFEQKSTLSKGGKSSAQLCCNLQL